nr:MAG TPA: hypothetical protein [Caudoviricetes sp.]
MWRGNLKKEHFVLQGRTLRFIFSERFVLRIIHRKYFLDNVGESKSLFPLICG